MVLKEKTLPLFEHLLWQKKAKEVKNLLDDPEAIHDLKIGIENVTRSILQLYQEFPDRNIIFVVGGKSRQLTEMLLKRVMTLLPEGHKAKLDLQDRVRLNDTENKNLYGEKTSLQENSSAADFSPIRDRITEENVFVFVDDDTLTGRKIFQTLEAARSKGLEARYIVFSGPQFFSSISESLRPKNWQELQRFVTIGTNNEKTTQMIRSLSSLLSMYINVRLNKKINLDPNETVSYDELEKTSRKMLHEVSDLIRKLKFLAG